MVSVRASGIWVEFPLYQGGSRSLKKAMLANATQGNLMRDALERINVMALRDVSLNLRNGDRLAIIGANGAGKSTLLKVLAGIYQPTRGRLQAVGRVTALLTGTASLNPDATGRENILMRGMFMGIPPKQMAAHLEEIAAFTDLGPYLDMPVRTYSSGMMVRLSFAASTATAPEILLMDEWLGAGDAAFQARARQRLVGFVGHASILVLASHSMALLEEWCNRAILLDQGQILAEGSVPEIAELHRRRSEVVRDRAAVADRAALST